MELVINSLDSIGTPPYFLTLGYVSHNQNRYETFDELWNDLEKYTVTRTLGKGKLLDFLKQKGTILMRSEVTAAGLKRWKLKP